MTGKGRNIFKCIQYYHCLYARLQINTKDFIVRVDDGKPDPLNLIVEIKGYRGEDAKDKANTMRAYWVPGVNNLGKFGRWGFAEFTAVYEMEAEFNELIEDLTGVSA